MKTQDEKFRVNGKIIAETTQKRFYDRKFLVLKAETTIFNEAELDEFIHWLISQKDELK